MKSWLVFISCSILLWTSCKEDQVTSRPRAYPRIEFPSRGLSEYTAADCPFTFKYPSYGEIQNKEKACWFDIFMPAFKARLHCTYVPVTDEAKYEDLVSDAFLIATKINERANYMEEMPIRNAQGVGGLRLTWTGPAASPIHFFLTDTTTHFFKAALYFDSKVQPDSLAPIASFIRQDMDTLISSFAWKK